MLRRKQGTILALVAVMGWFLLSGLAWAGEGIGDDQNNHNAPYLRMGVGARALGMGGAFTAVANDLTAGYWNPAGLTWTSGWQIGGMYSSGMEVDRSYNHIGFARNSDWGAYGFNWLNAGMTDINWRGSMGEDLGTGDFSDNAFMLSFGKRFDILSLGITGKYLRESLDADVEGDDAISGYGIDLGMGLMLAEQVRFGFNVQDIAGELGSSDDANDIPTNLRAGVAVMPIQGMTAAFDVAKTQNDDDYRFHLGGEYGIPLTEDLGAAIRAGLNDGDFAAGFGMSFSFLYADYAYVNDAQDFLNENHRFSVALKFGQEEMEYYGMRDTDKDGIPDDVDACPSLAEDIDGFMDTDGCPDPDNDGDGIPDMNDDCPTQAEDIDGWQDADGCADIDNDGDGILDKDDDCPNVAETFNGFEDDDGCPDEGPMIPIFAYINFKFGTAEISGADPVPVLEHVAELMNENEEMELKITGHTDSVGGDEYN
ncbi:MAG: PorV/PorQ family protein, partial [Candidatus Eisenbacteria bacterium]|nr:PorV/PorQ family protein [Candidatus Eisenbacteria bacterium]